jgi:hypothetical protein
MNHHRDCGSDNDFNDPAAWDRASYQSHPVDSMEPLSDEPNGYRAAALRHLELIYSVDQYLTEAKDARFAAIVVAIVFGWPSTRGFSIADIASQIGCSPLTITRACTRFREMAGLSSAGQLRPGAGSNSDKPAAAVRSVGLDGVQS